MNPATHSGAQKIDQSCGKLRYPDKKAAVSQINRLKKARGRHGRPEWLRAYYCEDCNGWHITKGIDKSLKSPAMFKGLRSGRSYKSQKSKLKIQTLGRITNEESD